MVDLERRQQFRFVCVYAEEHSNGLLVEHL